MPENYHPPDANDSALTYGMRYYATAARKVGVPEMWTDDAAGDIALACWQANNYSGTFIHYRAIDAARRYGPHTRYGTVRPETVGIEAAADVVAPETPDRYIPRTLIRSLVRGMWALTPGQYAGLRRSVLHLPLSNSQSVQAAHARKKLRRALT